MFRNACLAIAASLLIATGASAAETISAERMALAQEVVETTGVADGLIEVMEKLRPQLLASLQSQHGAKPEWTAAFLDAFNEELKAQRPLVARELARTYAEIYTEPELRDIVAFLRTPSGRAFATKFRKSEAKAQEASQRIVREMLPGILRRFGEKVGGLPGKKS